MSTVSRKPYGWPHEVRTYEVDGPADVPTLLRQLANELETADEDVIKNGLPGTYLVSLVETQRSAITGIGFTVLLDHDRT